MDAKIEIATTPDAIARCYEVMREMRTNLTSSDEFAERVTRQQEQGYLLAYLEARNEVRAVAGYRYVESFYAGEIMYVDDLVTCAKDRSLGFGDMFFDWLVAQA